MNETKDLPHVLNLQKLDCLLKYVAGWVFSMVFGDWILNQQLL